MISNPSTPLITPINLNLMINTCQENMRDGASPSHASKSMKIGVDLFVHLK